MTPPSSLRKKLIVEVGVQTDIGRRQANEDFGACLGASGNALPGRGVAAALADGVGGAKGGRVAAETAVRGFLDAYVGLDPMRGVKRNAIAAVAAMNAWVNTQGHVDSSLEAMACTFTALILRGRLAHIVHVGDTRLYRLRASVLTRLTTDHVPTRGAVRNVLLRAVGGEQDIRVDYAEIGRAHV